MRGKSRLRNVQVFADLAREEIDDLAMPRNCLRFLCATVDVNRVIAAFAEKFAALFLEMAQ